MKKIFTLFLVFCSLMSFSQSTTLVISQVYGAGGNAGATYNADYVELHNISAAPITMTGYSIQYAAATSSTWSGVYALPTATIAAGKYYLIQMSATGAVGTAITPDATANPSIAMAAAAGKVALSNDVTALSGCPTAAVVDLVGYGTTTTCFEGTGPAPAPSAVLADFRNNNGCTDTNDNAGNFTTALPAPRNSSTAAVTCGTSSTPTLSAGAVTTFGNVCPNTTAGPNSFTITGSNLTAGNITVGALAGFTYATTLGGTYASTLTIPETGGSFTQQIFVKFTPTAIQSYSGDIPVSGGGATAINVPVTGAGVNSAPTVTAGAATAITASSATVPGTITATGCTAVTAYGIEYNTTTGFANGSGTAVPSSNLTAGNFSSALSGLAAGTVYYYHSYATNGAGTAYSTQMSFTTITAAAASLSATTLTGFGNSCINTASAPNSFTVTGSNLTAGNITVGPLAGYTFSTATGGTYTATLTLPETGGSFSEQVFVELTPTAVQSYNGNIPVSGGGATAINVAASGTGVNTMATVIASAATGVTTTAATLPGSITVNGCSAVTAYGAEYSTTSGFANGNGTQVPASNLSAGNFSAALSGLATGTTYYYHTYATNGGGTAYSAEMSFTTTVTTITGGLVISQLYGSGGNSGAAYNADYVELKNTTTAPLSTAGLSVQYGSATVTGTWSGVFALPAANIPAGGFYLIQMTAAGTTGANLPTPDATATTAINMSGTAGRVALVSGTTALSGCPTAANYIDFVGYGTTATCFEGSGPAAAPSATNADFRKNNGCTDTNDNTADFSALPAAPRNSATAPISCSTTPTPTLTATALTAFGAVCTNTTAGPNSFTISGTNLTTANITVGPLAGYTFATTSTGTYTSTLTLTQTGGTYTQVVFVKFTPTAVQSYSGNIPVSGAGAATINVAASGSGMNTIAAVTSGAASVITANSATVAGSITATGCSAITAYGVEYSTTAGFANGTGTAVPSSNLSGGNFTSALSGLAPSTTYYYHAYATNSGGTAYGTQMSFTTLSATTPTLSATAPPAFGNICTGATLTNSFTITGTVLTAGNITVGPLAGFTFATASGGPYSATLTLPETGGSYSQQVFVKFAPAAVQSYNGNIPVSGGGASSINVSATGAGVNIAPTVTTGAASAITQTTATIAGTIPAAGCSAVTAYGIEYSTTAAFPNGSGTAVPASNLSGTTFSSAVTGLTVGTVYYYHAYATNGGGTSYGAQQSFTTAAAVLTSTPLAAFGASCVNAAAGPNSFTLSSTAVSAANIVVTAPAGYTLSATASGTYTQSLTLTQPAGPFTQVIYVKFTPTAVQNYTGNITVTGGGATITSTIAVSGSGINTGATVTTNHATNITSHSATLGGTITAGGCSLVTGYGVEYSGVRGFVNGSGIKVNSVNLNNGPFSVDVNGLVQATKYYFKAYATTAGGISYGAQDSLTTAGLNDGLIIYSSPIFRGGLLNYSMTNVKPAHYRVSLINSIGREVYTGELILDLNFIDARFTVPAYLPAGMYILQLTNTNDHHFRASKAFLLL